MVAVQVVGSKIRLVTCDSRQPITAVPRTAQAARPARQNILSKLTLLGAAAAAAATLTLAQPVSAAQDDFGKILPKDLPQDNVGQRKQLNEIVSPGDDQGSSFKANTEGPAGSIFAGDRDKTGQVAPSAGEKETRGNEFKQALKDSGDKNEPAEF
ncbi:hypothetical protein WJX84_006590 [Apatococcus fuscideae]|uniref:Uncharacterized protein n=1 Tax=Apatococcus fuscideae TaxID=2026836 RepID=A0AAW1SVG9_9CHLO